MSKVKVITRWVTIDHSGIGRKVGAMTRAQMVGMLARVEAHDGSYVVGVLAIPTGVIRDNTRMIIETPDNRWSYTDDKKIELIIGIEGADEPNDSVQALNEAVATTTETISETLADAGVDMKFARPLTTVDENLPLAENWWACNEADTHAILFGWFPDPSGSAPIRWGWIEYERDGDHAWFEVDNETLARFVNVLAALRRVQSY